VGAVASEEAKQLSHSLTLAVNLAVLSNLAQHTWHRSHSVRASVLVGLATALTSADPLRHVLQDSGVWPASKSHMYRLPESTCASDDTCMKDLGAVWRCESSLQQCVCTEASWRCLSALGMLFSAMAWLGFACLFAGVLSGTGLVPKLRAALTHSRRPAHADAAQ
jgi:hypothetical protein